MELETKILGIPLLPLALGTAGLISLAQAFVMNIRQKQLVRKSQVARDSWLHVPARVLYSRVEKSRPQSGPRPGLEMFSARFRYEYTLDGKSYEGTQYTLMKEWSSSNREPHDKEVAEFPEGRDVKIWVNPQDPSESVLKVDPASFPDLTLLFFLLTLLGLGLIGAALVIGFVKPS